MAQEKFPGETTYLNTEEWQQAFKQWLRSEGRGSIMRLAAQLGVDHGVLSRLKEGAVRKSTLIGPISRLAGIPLPRRIDDDGHAVLMELKTEDPDLYHSMVEVATVRLSRGKRTKSH